MAKPGSPRAGDPRREGIGVLGVRLDLAGVSEREFHFCGTGIGARGVGFSDLI